MNDLDQIKRLLIVLAEFYGASISESRLDLFAVTLEDLGPSKVAQAIKIILRDSKQKVMPFPAELRDLIEGSPQEVGIDIANRIVQAISSYGWTNPDKAKTFLGEVGWFVVEREGGWEKLCARVNDENLPVLKAQWREVAKTKMRRALLGQTDAPPSLPRPITKQVSGPQSLGSIINNGDKS